MSATDAAYLAPGLPVPVASPDGLDLPYWSALRENRVLVQQCTSCATWRFGPEWICHRCHSFETVWREVLPRGRIYSWERVWHPVVAALKAHGPYLVVLVELDHPAGIRMLGNLLGDPHQLVSIGTPVTGVFEHHPETSPPCSLLQWQVSSLG